MFGTLPLGAVAFTVDFNGSSKLNNERDPNWSIVFAKFETTFYLFFWTEIGLIFFYQKYIFI